MIKRKNIMIPGSTAQYNAGGLHIRAHSHSDSSVEISGNGIFIGGNRFDYEIDQDYDVKPGDRVVLYSLNESLDLRLQEGSKVKVKGDTRRAPSYSNNTLFIDDLKGQLWLPQGISDLELAVKTMNGFVKGDVAHKGTIEAMNGDIELKLHAPLAIDAFAIKGNANIQGMESKGGGKYAPIGEPALGGLRVSTMNGNIKITYQRTVLLPAPQP